MVWIGTIAIWTLHVLQNSPGIRIMESLYDHLYAT